MDAIILELIALLNEQTWIPVEAQEAIRALHEKAKQAAAPTTSI
jgi:hypothetical protein